MTRQDDKFETIVKETSATNLVEIRAKNGLSRQKMAKEIGISEAALRNYEGGDRQLPQSTRLRFMLRFRTDPIPGKQLLEKLKLPGEGVVEANKQDKPTFWHELNAECRTYRQRNYSPLAIKLLILRDQLFFGSCLYVLINFTMVQLNIPFGIKINGIDWVLIAATMVEFGLFVPVLSESPLLKIAQHHFGRRK